MKKSADDKIAWKITQHVKNFNHWLPNYLQYLLFTYPDNRVEIIPFPYYPPPKPKIGLGSSVHMCVL